jgi:hypothetical protein
MGKQKYSTTAGATTSEGERRERDHTKTGKLARRRETRRLEAIARQVNRIKKLETALGKAKDKGKAQKALTHAQFTLQTIRGGVSHEELRKRFETPTQDETTPSKQESAPKSKKTRKASHPRKGKPTQPPSSI